MKGECGLIGDINMPRCYNSLYSLVAVEEITI